MIRLPRPLAQAALNWLATPDATSAVRIYAAFSACLNDNPHNGVMMRMGPDQCEDVTKAIEARNNEIADLIKRADDAKKADEKPASAPPQVIGAPAGREPPKQ
jgi:hypothetical protein